MLRAPPCQCLFGDMVARNSYVALFPAVDNLCIVFFDLRSRFCSDGAQRRATGATEMNAQSSRSHSVFTIKLETFTTGEVPPMLPSRPPGPEPSLLPEAGGRKKGSGGSSVSSSSNGLDGRRAAREARVGYGQAEMADARARKAAEETESDLYSTALFRLVDLAGSERNSQTKAEGQRLEVCDATIVNFAVCLRQTPRVSYRVTSIYSHHSPHSSDVFSRLSPSFVNDAILIPPLIAGVQEDQPKSDEPGHLHRRPGVGRPPRALPQRQADAPAHELAGCVFSLFGFLPVESTPSHQKLCGALYALSTKSLSCFLCRFLTCLLFAAQAATAAPP